VCIIDPFVQIATRQMVRELGDTGKAKEKALEIVWDKYAVGTYEEWDTCKAWEPHAQMVLRYNYDSPRSHLRQAYLLYCGATYAYHRGKLKIAEEKVGGNIHIRTLHSDSIEPLQTLQPLSLLSSVYVGQERSTEAEELRKQILRIRTEALGSEHPETLGDIASRATIYMHQQLWTEAEELLVPLLAKNKRVLGAENSDTLTAVTNLTVIFNHQKQLEKSTELNKEVLETEERMLGADHPHTLTSKHNLAILDNDAAGRKAAAVLEAQVLETR